MLKIVFSPLLTMFPVAFVLAGVKHRIAFYRVYHQVYSVSHKSLNFTAIIFQVCCQPDNNLSTLNPLPNMPWFSRVCCTRLLKTLWEKEKLLVTSNFSFSHSVFYPFGELSAIFIKFDFVICTFKLVV